MECCKEVSIANVTRSVYGSDEDRYFQNLDAFAAETDPLFRFCEKYVQNGTWILDVGGNIGLTSIAIHLACPMSNIVAFESRSGQTRQPDK